MRKSFNQHEEKNGLISWFIFKDVLLIKKESILTYSVSTHKKLLFLNQNFVH